ncbi:hypothetical protein CB1_002578024 [Camelus ferus]|nr:hypothetical protein CB1_002578024 [Camelus ferus]
MDRRQSQRKRGCFILLAILKSSKEATSQGILQLREAAITGPPSGPATCLHEMEMDGLWRTLQPGSRFGTVMCSDTCNSMCIVVQRTAPPPLDSAWLA